MKTKKNTHNTITLGDALNILVISSQLFNGPYGVILLVVDVFTSLATIKLHSKSVSASLNRALRRFFCDTFSLFDAFDAFGAFEFIVLFILVLSMALVFH